MSRATKWLVGLALALPTATTVARAGVADPLAAVRSLYAPYSAGGKPSARTATIDTLYAWADRNLKRKLLANGVCTVPLGKRDITCASKVDPIVAGVATPLPDPTVTTIAINQSERQIAVAFLDDETKLDLVYHFVRNGGAWELADLEAKPPHRPAWKLSQFIGGD